MSRYYASSRPFVWLRKQLKIGKPQALPLSGAGGWNEWDQNLRSQRPIAYWFTETLPDWLEKPAEWFVDPLWDAKCYIRNRWITRSHMMKTGLKPGDYHELDTRILHGLFTELVDFVEVDKAHMQVYWGEHGDGKKYQLPWWRTSGWLRWSDWRCAAAGLDYLNWEAGLFNEADWYDDPQDPAIGQPTSQALAAREILELYNWWVNVRPNRPDPMDAGGWSDFCDQMRERYGDSLAAMDNRTPEEQEQSRIALDKTHALEQTQEQEDEHMLIRLIKIRRSLWT